MEKDKFVGISKVGEKGQIVIPKEARDMFDIKPGDSIIVLCDKERGIALLKADSIEDLTEKVFQKEENRMLAIETNKLTKRFKEKIAVNNIDLKINEGELFALLGTNGAGKTTIIKMLSTLILPTNGEIKINGLDIIKDRQKIKEILNVSPQETAIAPNLSVKENLEFMAGVYQISKSQEKIEELVKIFKLEEVLNQKAKTLSGGWQRKVSIAIALINEPKILFLDEPTLGLDVIARKELWNIIENLKGKITIILTTHYMEEAESLSDRIGIMAKGKIVDIGTAEELIKKAGTKNFEDAFVKIATGGEL